VSRRRPVPLLLGAEFSAGVARAALATALGWQAYQRSHEPLVLGLLGLAEFLPALLLALPAGHIADRHDRRLVAAGASAAATAVALVLALDAASGDTEVWPLYLLAFCGGAAMAFEVPAFNPLLAASVPPAGLARVISLSSVSWQSATIVGPVTAGALQTVSDPAPYVAAAAACVVAGLLLLAVPRTVGTAHVPEEGYASATWGDVTAGIRFVRVTPALLGAISLDLVAVLFGAATVVFGLSTSFPLSLLALAVLAGADMVSVLIRGTLAPLLTPPELRGRVSALESVFIRASNELGAFESGVAAAVLGAVPAVVLGGIASMAVAVIWCFWFPSIRRVDRFEDLPDPAAARTAAAAAR
jgi:MFS family permease